MSKWEELPESRRKSLNKASAKYVKNHRDRISLNLPKGDKERWMKEAEKQGFVALTPFVIACVEKCIDSDIDVSKNDDTIVDN